jgi:thiamine biosynthesis lipoprotein
MESRIDQPSEKSKRKLEAVVNLNNRALATSGTENFILREIKNFSSLILNGLPAKHNLLSTTVIADDGITADAYARFHGDGFKIN